ncbi:MAG: D-alanyl-D-alanine carboxypeptidase [Chloroflexi bacterium]|nr:D-alanyl-D-alanine carboxypeptidase [Chloroflexota bacterium]
MENRLLMNMLHRVWLGALTLSLPFVVGFGPPKLVESDTEAMPVYRGDIARIVAATPPQFSGTAALIMDAATGQVAYEHHGYARIAPASITKLMTALVTIDKAKLTDRVVIRKEHMVEGSAMGLLPGEELTVEDLLWGMLLPSGNDAAMALASTLGGGTPDRFLGWMNEKAKSLGMRDTQFHNPHGLDDEEHYSTAYDLSLMARAALANPTLANIMKTRSQTVRAGRRAYLLTNTNRLLFQPDQYPGVDGVKTGFTDNSGDSLIASVTRNGKQVIVAVLGTNMERAPAAGALIDYTFKAFEWTAIGAPVFPQWRSGPDKVRAVAPAASRQQMTFRWQRPYLRGAVDMTAAAAADKAQTPGGPAGVLHYTIGGAALMDIPLYLSAGQGAG